MSAEEGRTTAAQATAAVPSLNLVPTTKAAIDLFARAPQVKKMSRKDKQKIALAAAMGTEGKTKDSGKAAEGGLFATVFAEEEVAKVAELEANQKKSQSGRKKNKKQILRHALHKNEEEDARTAFVGNLPNTIDKKAVAKVFKDCGAIESVRVRCQALASPSAATSSSSSPAGGDQGEGGADDGSAPSGQPSPSSSRRGRDAAGGQKDVGRAVRVLRGDIKRDPQYSATAYVLFKDASSVAVAVEKKNGVVFKSRHLVVTSMDPASAAYPPETSIFLGNIAYSTTEEDIWKFFSEHGIADVKRVRLVRDRDTGDCKGFGYVEFHSKKSVAPAIATRGADLDGRELRIVHVNKSKDVKAITASRREKRGRGADASPQQRDGRGGANKRSRTEGDGGAGRRGKDAAAGGAGGQPSWMGVVTNPRRKIPRDLRPLTENPAERRFKGPRPPVKRKMRNPEKQ